MSKVDHILGLLAESLTPTEVAEAYRALTV